MVHHPYPPSPPNEPPSLKVKTYQESWMGLIRDANPALNMLWENYASSNSIPGSEPFIHPALMAEAKGFDDMNIFTGVDYRITEVEQGYLRDLYIVCQQHDPLIAESHRASNTCKGSRETLYKFYCYALKDIMEKPEAERYAKDYVNALTQHYRKELSHLLGIDYSSQAEKEQRIKSWGEDIAR